MPRISLLPPDVANQIAAGEVVERPASVVKELVENALDAGAETLTVVIDGGGLARVSVTDDGIGMLPEDLALSVVRHATSKIRSAEDLVGVSTYGFRGEALPSIASVSRFKVTSRARGSDEGAEVTVEGGAEARLRPAGCATGTTVLVEDLFYNTPARRKFMRSPQTEGAQCVEAVLRMAIPRPDVRFVVRRDGRVARELLRHKDLGARVRELWPEESLVEMRGAQGELRVLALLGPPEKARSGASSLAIYVNGRHVRDKLLIRAVAQSYGSTLEGGRYPVGALLIEVPPEDIDVNVHPQKTEVRFASQGRVFESVCAILRDAANTAPWAQAVARPADFWSSHITPGPALEKTSSEKTPSAPNSGLSSPPESPDLAKSPISSSQSSVSSNPSPDIIPRVPLGAFVHPVQDPSDPWVRLVQPVYPPSEYTPTLSDRDAPPPERTRGELLPEGAFASLRYIGQVRRMYLVCEGEHGLVVLDQHAAAERVTFENLRRAYARRSVSMQPMLVPERVEVSEDDVALVEEHAQDLNALGLELTIMGPNTLAVRAVPAMLLRSDPRKLCRDVISELGRQGNDFSRAADLVLATMACHGSVRGGDVLADEEARALLKRLDEVDFAGHCPHGRPVIFSMRWSELERKVGR